MRLRRITSIFIITIFLNGCGLSAQEWQAISDGLYHMERAIYGNNLYPRTGNTNYNKSSKSSFTKVCDYTCLGSAYSITVGSTELCPINPPCDPNAGSASQSYTSSGSTTCFKDYEYTIDNLAKTKNAKNIEVLPISALMGEAIKRISNSTSVSDLFK